VGATRSRSRAPVRGHSRHRSEKIRPQPFQGDVATRIVDLDLLGTIGPGSPQLLANLCRMPIDRPPNLIETLLESIEPRRECLYRVRNEVEASGLWQPRAVSAES
jgi:hypothetical protein